MVVTPTAGPRFTGLALSEDVTSALQAVLPHMAERTVAAVTVEVPSYADAFSGRMGQNIENAVQMALGAFLRLATRAEDSDAAVQLSPALDGAYELGRGEARHGRPIDVLLAAYRVGARVAWRELSSTAVQAGLDATTMSRFAELVFAFIDELSASSVTGHADELATTGRVRDRYLDALGRHLLAGEAVETLEASAEKADWTPPRSLTAVLLPTTQARGVTTGFGAATLQLNDDLPGVDATESLTLVLVPDMDGPARRQLVRPPAGRRSWVGPSGPWADVGKVAAGTAANLAATLRSWLLHQGHRDAVAADLFVHAQTVRYRMTQLRELYGDALDDPRTILELTVALGVPETSDPD